MALFSWGKKARTQASGKHEYIINETQRFARSISRDEIDVLLYGGEATYLLTFLNTIKQQGKKVLKLDSPQMYIEVSVDMYLQDLAIGIGSSTKSGENFVRLGQSFEQLFLLYMSFNDAYNNNDFISSDPTAKDLLERLGRAFAAFSKRLGYV